ncbi:Collagenase-like protease [Pseudomonas syringae pv. actinidiae]|uniref:Collagenase-like protease n=1 Tax=Pseudomonas syringae pv. actinidiae TaxID=103796 RepID=A0AAN4TKZ8_PSESF|nr:Collagenase-like protease [Pseudomonas syringae pv. actinidiae]
MDSSLSGEKMSPGNTRRSISVLNKQSHCVQASGRALKSPINAGDHPSSSGRVCKMRRATLTCCLHRVCLMPFGRFCRTSFQPTANAKPPVS